MSGRVDVRSITRHGTPPLFVLSPGVNVDASGLAGPAQEHTAGETVFKFTRDEAHRELNFRDPSELMDFVSRILAEFQNRRLPTSKDDLLGYADQKLAAQDAEWVDACANHPKAKEWPSQVAKYRKKQLP